MGRFMRTLIRVFALSVLGAAGFLSVSCENMDTGAVSNVLGTVSDNVTNSKVSSAADTANTVLSNSQPNNDQ